MKIKELREMSVEELANSAKKCSTFEYSSRLGSLKTLLASALYAVKWPASRH
jgi:hypothetical protein